MAGFFGETERERGFVAGLFGETERERGFVTGLFGETERERGFIRTSRTSGCDDSVTLRLDCRRSVEEDRERDATVEVGRQHGTDS